MSPEWMSLEQVAQVRRITLDEARALADREHWPKVFKLHDTFVLPPGKVR